MDILEFNYEWRCIHVIIDWSVIILYDFNKNLGSKKTLSLITFFSAICNFQIFFKFYVVVLTLLSLDWPEHVDVYSLPFCDFCIIRFPSFHYSQSFLLFPLHVFRSKLPLPFYAYQAILNGIMAPNALLSQALQKWPHH